MKLIHIFEKATDFGSFRSHENLFSFSLKVLLYILPAVILGHYTDISVKTMKKRKILGTKDINYISFQTLIVILTLFLLTRLLKDFTSEFQQSMAGGYFIVLYFGMQTNYIEMLKNYMTSLI